MNAKGKKLAKFRAEAPRKLIPAVLNKLMEALEAGASLNESCAYIGVTSRALQQARAKDSELEVKIQHAREVGKVKLILISRRGANKDPKHALNLLARMYPDEWSERRRLEHSGPNGGTIDIRHLSDDELERIAAGSGE